MKDNLFSEYIAKNYAGKILDSNELKAVKSGTVDAIVRAFAKLKNQNYENQLISVLGSMQSMLGDIVVIDDISQQREMGECFLACQMLDGDDEAFLGFTGEEKSLLNVASLFAHEEFNRLDSDTYDSICEFINCIDGIFATQLSKEQNVELSMHPPVFFDRAKIKSNSGFYVVTLKINSIPIKMILSYNENICIA